MAGSHSGVPGLDLMPEPVLHRCAQCPAAFSNYRLYLVHQSIAHGIKAETRRRQVSFDRLADSTAGLPLCALCGKRFTRWTGLQAHIEQGWCPKLDPADPAPTANTLLGPIPPASATLTTAPPLTSLMLPGRPLLTRLSLLPPLLTAPPRRL